MRLKALLVADHASVDASGKIYVNGGGITRLTTPLPGILPFLSLLALFVVDEDDLHQEHWRKFESPALTALNSLTFPNTRSARSSEKPSRMKISTSRSS